MKVCEDELSNDSRRNQERDRESDKNECEREGGSFDEYGSISETKFDDNDINHVI